MITTLNPQQQGAAFSLAERRLVVAGPGSGKTQTLVAAVVAAAQQHGAPGCVVLTYTNAAAGELAVRLSAEGVTGLGFCGTLHAFLLRQLTEWHGGMLSVIDDDQRQSIVASCMEDMGVKVPVSHVLATLEQPVRNTNPSKVELVALEYHLRLKSAGLVDFNTILEDGTRACMELAKASRWSYHSLFADEVQDAAHADWCFYGTAPFKYKYLTGDSDQAIYGFRGGNNELFVRLAQAPDTIKPAWQVHLLEDNYRCRPAICVAAQKLVEHNKLRVAKRTMGYSSAEDDEGYVEAHRCENAAQEMRHVAAGISWCIGEFNMELKDLAVLARTNAIANAFARYLEAGGCKVATVEMAERPYDWVQAKLLLTVLANPWNDLAVMHLITATESRAEANQLQQAAAIRMKSINEVLGFRYGKGDSSLEVDLGRHGISAASKERIHDAARELSRFGGWSLNDLIVYLGEQDTVASRIGDGVTCCTIHAAKGKEWRSVFVVGCEEGLLPHRRDTETPALLEEARRLMFVAMTRAKERLALTWCANRPENRGPNLPPGPMQVRAPSRFISEAGLTT